MSQPTAVIKVVCKPDKLEETANLLAWTVGHRVEVAERTSHADARWLFVFTDLAYHDDDDTILEHLGLDIIGKLGGVLSWTVIPSDVHEAEARMAQAPALPTKTSSLEETLTQVLSGLPVPVSIMKRNSGKYAWKWQDATGQADTFIESVLSALSLAMRSYKAVQGELNLAGSSQPGSELAMSLETELMNELVTLPTPMLVMQGRDGAYLWKWGNATGHAESFGEAVTACVTLAMTSYAATRSQLIGS
ncbi:MAG TPA: hypothetical protein VFZ66_07510 [Herpetosiphonaceae bacterium]